MCCACLRRLRAGGGDRAASAAFSVYLVQRGRLLEPLDNTGNLRVCVVNEDAGASSELTGELHVGDMIVDELHGNTQLDWGVRRPRRAMAELDAGEELCRGS